VKLRNKGEEYFCFITGQKLVCSEWKSVVSKGRDVK